MSAQAPEQRLYDAFVQYVNPDTFDFSSDCLTVQTANGLGGSELDSAEFLAQHFGVPLERVDAVYLACFDMSARDWRNLPCCLAVAREILGVPNEPSRDELVVAR